MNRRDFIKNTVAVGVASAAFCRLGVSLERTPEGRRVLLRPPGALEESAFLARCIRCHRCADACPNNAIVLLDGARGARQTWTPAIQARRQACMLCNRSPGDFLRCTDVCPSGALQRIHKDPETIQNRVSMGTAVIDDALCYSYNQWTCGACYRACPFPGRAMTLGLWERPTVNPEGCVGCGLCERACIRYPQAIRVGPGVHKL